MPVPVEMSASSDPKTWKRLSIRERGHFSNYPTLFPVVAIIVGPEFIEIRRRWRKPIRWSWSSVRVAVHERQAHKSYGAYSGGKHLQRLCVIEGDGERRVFDISENFPDFLSPDALLAEIKKYTQIEEHPPVRKRWTDWWKLERF